MPNVTKEQLEEMQGVVHRAKSMARNLREKGDRVMGAVVQTGEVVGTSFALGYVRGRYTEVKVAGVPLELVVGATAHIAALFSGAKYADDMQNVGDGALASYLVAVGAKIGDEHRKKAGTPAPAPPAPQVTSGYAYPMFPPQAGYAYAPGGAAYAQQQQQQYPGY